MYLISDCIDKKVTFRLIKNSSIEGNKDLVYYENHNKWFFEDNDTPIDYFLTFDGSYFFIKKPGEKDTLLKSKSRFTCSLSRLADKNLEEMTENFYKFISTIFETIDKDAAKKLLIYIINTYNASGLPIYPGGEGNNLEKF